MQSPDETAEAYVMTLASAKPVRVSAANIDLPKQPLGETRVIKWKAKDGKEVEGLLTLPVNYDRSKKYALILNIHGGPAGNFGETFIGASGIYPIAAFAARGWATLRPNSRGSTGYGLAFRSATVNDWGGGDYQDLMTGVDAVIAMGVADPNKLAVMGWSYGGFMTNWVVTQTNRFKCAAAGAGRTSARVRPPADAGQRWPRDRAVVPVARSGDEAGPDDPDGRGRHASARIYRDPCPGARCCALHPPRPPPPGGARPSGGPLSPPRTA